MINIYSDTQSAPTDAMRDAMCRAPVGDEQKGADPTVNELLRQVRGILGKESAIFLPSGTMCNAIAVASHCARGDALMTEADSHLMRYEAGGMAAISGVIPEAIKGEAGRFTASDVREHYQKGSRYTPTPTLLTVEQTCNLAGGVVWDVTALDAVAAEGRRLGMKTHMDGARLFNAAIASGQAAKLHCAGYDSVWVDFTKGLSAPFGAVLCGSHEFVEKAWQWKHRLGGAMRQAGIMAAACLYALEHNIERLSEDHRNASLFNALLSELPEIQVRFEKVDTNIVYFDLADKSRDANSFLAELAQRGLKVGLVGKGFRAVTYADITERDIQTAVRIIRDALDS